MYVQVLSGKTVWTLLNILKSSVGVTEFQKYFSKRKLALNVNFEST